MKQFAEWLATGPLKDEAATFTKHEIQLMNIAYLEGAGAALQDTQAELSEALTRMAA